MKKNTLLILLTFSAVFLFAAAGCSNLSSGNKENPPVIESKKTDPFIERIIDKNANPAIDFYKYSVGTWLRENPVTESKPSIIYGEDSCGDEWFENFKKTGGEPVYDELKRLFVNYKQYEDVEFYKNHLEDINNAKTIQDCLREMERMHKDAVYSFAAYSVTQAGNKFGISINSLMGAFIFYKGVFKYFDSEPERKANVNNFLASINYPKNMDEIILGVNRFHNDGLCIDLSNPADEAYQDIFELVNVPVSSLNIEPVKDFFVNSGIDEKYLGDGNITKFLYNYLKILYNDLPETQVENFKDYLRYCLLVSPGYSEVEIDKYNISKYYTDQKYSSLVEKDITNIFNEIKAAFKKRIQDNKWLSEDGKQAAIIKLEAMTFLSGKPVSWPNEFLISKNSNWKNYESAVRDMQKQQRKRVFSILENNDRKSALYAIIYAETPAYTNNGVYKYDLNSLILFPGMICSYLYNKDRDPAYNYGSIGYAMGHEITHGFDSEGAKYDKDGNKNKLFADLDTKNFEALHEKVIKYYGNIKYTLNNNCDPEVSLAENIADLGGIAISYDALKNHFKDESAADFNEREKHYFVSFSSSLLANFTPEALVKNQIFDKHTAFNVRHNAVLAQCPAWFNLYGKPESNDEYGNYWYVKPEDRIVIW